MKYTPLWTEQFARPEDIPSDDLPSEVDFAIVGSGYTGLNAAIVLAKAGASVAVIEQETIGWGASSRNGSMLTPGMKPKIKVLERAYGKERAKYFWNWSVEAMDHVTNIVREENIDCDYEINGMACVAIKPSHIEAVKGYGEMLKTKFGYDRMNWVPREQIKSEIGSDIFYGALIDESGARLQPAKFTYGLAKAASNHGAKLVENARVTKISRQASGFRVLTSKGDLNAKEVLLATGGYTTAQLGKARRGIFPVGSYIVVTEPLSPELQAEISPKNRVFYDSKIFLNYFCLTPDGRMLLGGRNNLSPNLDLTKSGELLQQRLLEIFPQLEGIPLTHSWTGRLGISFDQMPHIGTVDGIHYAYGYSGHGISIGSCLGKEVGELLAGIRTTSAFREINHPKTILANLDPLFLPFVSAYHKFLDAKS
jgi:glycine/D-amino acid oxidase-like deaminating enzyme